MTAILGFLLLVYGVFMIGKCFATGFAYYQIYVKKVPFEKFKNDQLKSMKILHYSAVENVVYLVVFFWSGLILLQM